MTDQSIYNEIHNLLLAFQRRNRFTEKAFDSDLTLLDFHVLTECDAQGSVTGSFLSSQLLVSSVNVSRAVQKLVDLDLIKLSDNPEDKRSQLISLDRKGRTVLTRIDKTANALIKGFLGPLTKEQKVRLSDFFEQFIKGLAVPPSLQRRGDDPYRIFTRLLARGMGIFDRSYMGSKLSTTMWHSLRLVDDSAFQVTSQSIEKVIGLDQSTVSRTISKLVKEGYIKKAVASDDRRVQILSITQSGKRALEKIEDTAAKKIEKAFDGYPKRKLKEELEVFRIFALGEEAASFSSEGGIGEVVQLDDEADFKAAREYLLKKLVEADRLNECPSVVFSPANLGFSLIRDGEMVMVVEAQRVDGRLYVENLAASFDKLEKNEELTFLKEVARQSCVIDGVAKVYVSRQSLAFSTAKGFGIKPGRTGEIIIPG